MQEYTNLELAEHFKRVAIAVGYMEGVTPCARTLARLDVNVYRHYEKTKDLSEIFKGVAGSFRKSRLIEVVEAILIEGPNSAVTSLTQRRDTQRHIDEVAFWKRVRRT